MSTDIDIEKLAELARLDLSTEDEAELAKSITGILDYVASVEEVAADTDGPEAGRLRNVMREDGEPHAPDAFRAALLREAPAVDEDGFIVVPPILAR